MIEVLKQAYQLLLTEPHAPTVCNQLEVILRQAIAEWESQEPVGYLEIDDIESQREYPHNCRNVNLWYESGEGLVAVYTHPPQRTEQNFCSRCGKRTNDIHTCTPPMEKNNG